MSLTKEADSWYARGYRTLQIEDFEKNIKAKKFSPTSFTNYTSRQSI